MQASAVIGGKLLGDGSVCGRTGVAASLRPLEGGRKRQAWRAAGRVR